jgi:nitrogen fixation NifU-like protein
MNLYQEQLLALSKDLSHCGDPSSCPRRAFRRNPACGDEIALGFHCADDRISGLCFQLRGCAVSQASAAALARGIEGLSPADARDRLARALAFFDSAADWSADWGRDEMPALGALRARPMRMACVRLPWEALADVLDAP